MKYTNLFMKFTSLATTCCHMAPSSALRGHIQVEEKALLHSVEVHFFSFRVVSLWNNLPSDVVSAPSVNVSKERLDKHWKEYCFTLDPEDFIRREQVISQQAFLA